MTKKELAKSLIILLANTIKKKNFSEFVYQNSEQKECIEKIFGKYILTYGQRFSFVFRHIHIARCELAGRTRDQIEIPAENYKADESLIKKLKEYFTDPLKMYVVVRADLSQSQQAVQAGHALAQYLQNWKDHEWKNGILIYLKIANEKELFDLHQRLVRYNIKNSYFREEDLNNEMTALAAVTNNYNIFKQFELL